MISVSRIKIPAIFMSLYYTDLGFIPKTYNYQEIGELSELRKTYIHALRKADYGDYEELMLFIRS